MAFENIDEDAKTLPVPAEPASLPPKQTEPGDRGARRQSSARIEVPTELSDLPQIGGYVLEEEIGGGGMAVVYRAYHAGLQKHVALKLIKTQASGRAASESEITRFLTEARTAASINHANVVPVIDVGEQDGLFFLVMELIHGGSLAEVLDDVLLKPARALEILRQCAEAVGEAHRNGVIHRDLKPHNILMRDGSEPMVADFGLARQQDVADHITRTGDILGTPTYMSPEQASGDLTELGPPCDVWGLGVILYEMLVGQPPFRGENSFELLNLILNSDPELPRKLNPQIPADLEAICLKCLEKSPGKRYPDGHALAEDCRRYQEGYAVAARRAGWIYRWQKWNRRNQRGLGVVAIVLVSVAVALLVPSVRDRWEQSRLLEIEQRYLAQTANLSDTFVEAIDRSTSADELNRLAQDRLSEQGIQSDLLQKLKKAASAALPKAFQRRLLAEAQRRIPRVKLLARCARRRGDLLSAASKPEQAFRAYGRAYRLDPTGPDGIRALAPLARRLLQKGQKKLVLSICRNGYRDAPGPDVRHAFLEIGGAACLMLHRFSDAVATFDAARKIGPLSPRPQILARLAERLQHKTQPPDGMETLVAIANVDGVKGDELLYLRDKKLEIWTWKKGQGFRLLRQHPFDLRRSQLHAYSPSKTYRPMEVADLTGDGAMDLCVVERTGRVRIYGSLMGDLRLLFSWKIPGGQHQLAHMVADVDGDGRAEVYLSSKGGGLWTLRRSGGSWQDRVFDPRIRSVIYTIGVLKAGAKKLLLVCAAEWNDFAIRAYRIGPDGSARLAWKQKVGAPRRMLVADLDLDGVSEVVISIHDGDTHYIPPILGQDLSSLLPRGATLLKYVGERLIPVPAQGLRGLGFAAVNLIEQPLVAAGTQWVVTRPTLRRLKGDRQQQSMRLRTLHPAMVVEIDDISAGCIADLDGDGQSELFARRQSRPVELFGLGAIDPGQAGRVLGGPAFAASKALKGTGEADLVFAGDLIRLELFDEAHRLLEKLSELKTRVAGAAALERIDLFGRVSMGRALQFAEAVIKQHPAVARQALWKRIGIHRSAGDYQALGRDVDRLEKLSLPREDRPRVERLRQLVTQFRSLQLHQLFPGRAKDFIATDPLLAPTGPSRQRLWIRSNLPHAYGLPLSLDGGLWRLRARISFSRFDWSNELSIGLFREGEPALHTALHLFRQGGNWNSQILGLLEAKDEGLLVNTRELEVELLYEPSDGLLWTSLRRLDNNALLFRQKRAASVLAGRYLVGFYLGRQGGQAGPNLGQLQLLGLTLETARPLEIVKDLKKLISQPEVVMARALLDQPARLVVLFQQRLEGKGLANPAYSALLKRSFALTKPQSARLVRALEQAAAGDRERLAGLYHRAKKAGRLEEVLLCLNAMPASPQIQVARFEQLFRLQRWRRILANLERLPDGTKMPRWYRAYLRGRSLLGLDRYAKAEEALVACLELAKQAGVDLRVQKMVDSEIQRAHWKRQKLSGKMPFPTLKNYAPDKSWQRGD